MNAERSKFTVDEYEALNDSGGGVCLNCGFVQDSGIEPDAERYVCSECGSDDMTGLEQALLLGRITIVDEGATCE